MPSWKRVITSGSNAALNTLNVTTAFTASGLNYPTADNGVGSFLQTNGSGNLSFQYVKTIYEEIYNGETTQILKGTPVYVSGAVGATSVVYRADAGNASKMPVVYISADNIAPGATGRGIALGLITGVNTTGYPPGTEIYVAVGGGWTSTRPTGSAIVQTLGYVTKEGNGGQGIVLNPGPNSLPNLPSGSVWVGNSNSIPVAVATSSLGVASASFASTSSFTTAITGTTNYISKFTGTKTLGNSQIFDNGTNVGIGTTTPSARLDVRAQGALSTNIVFRVRNSTDTQNFLVVNGAGDVYNNGAGGINTNTFFGENVGRNTTGGNNTAIGRSALESNTTGYSNTAIGLNALLNNTTGYYNTAIGISALESNTTGGFNTAIGLGALFSNTTGGNNTAIGREAGNLISDSSNNTITNNSIFIGVDTRALADNQTNQIVIGNGAIGLGSNSVVLGNESIVTTALRGNVGIGTTAPSTLLDVNGIITAIGGNSTQWNSKQEALVSGTNIKTLNGNNVLGSGDLSTKGIHTLVKPAVGETTSFLLYGQTIGNVVGQANRLIAVPYIPATTITCSSLYINISTALAGSNARILIYSDDNGKPGTKIYESANLDCSTTGIKTATTTQTFNAGTIYWICSHSSSTQTFSSANPAALIPINVSGISVFTSYYITPTFGSAPTTFGTGTFIQLALPFIGIKI